MNNEDSSNFRPLGKIVILAIFAAGISTFSYTYSIAAAIAVVSGLAAVCGTIANFP